MLGLHSRVAETGRDVYYIFTDANQSHRIVSRSNRRNANAMTSQHLQNLLTTLSLNKKAVLSQANRAMPQLFFFRFTVRRRHSLHSLVYKFKSSQASKARLQSSKHIGTKHPVTSPDGRMSLLIELQQNQRFSVWKTNLVCRWTWTGRSYQFEGSKVKVTGCKTSKIWRHLYLWARAPVDQARQTPTAH